MCLSPEVLCYFGIFCFKISSCYRVMEGKKTYGHIYNLREMQKSMRTPITKEVLRGAAKMIIGGLTILILMQIPMYFVNQAKQERIEQMKEQ